jgi:uncharacterized repeat protein (TIGR01451 family)
MTESPTPSPIPAFSVGISASDPNPEPGDTLTFTISLDVGISTAVGVVLTDVLPPGLTFNRFVSGPVGMQNGANLTWDMGVVTPGQVVIMYEADVEGSVAPGTVLVNHVDADHAGAPTASTEVTMTCRVNTPTSTPETTASQAVETPVVFPNPVDGRTESVQVLIPLGQDAGEVKVQVFTTAYRKVLEKSLGSMKAGTGSSNVRSLELRDLKGKKLANGVYYLVVATHQGKAIGKFLIVR